MLGSERVGFALALVTAAAVGCGGGTTSASTGGTGGLGRGRPAAVDQERSRMLRRLGHVAADPSPRLRGGQRWRPSGHKDPWPHE